VRRDATAAEIAANSSAGSMGAGQVVLIVLAAGFIPVTGILAAIAIPAYQDYTIRAQITQGLSAAAVYRDAVAEQLSSGRAPSEIGTDDVAVDLPANLQYVKSIDVANSIVVVTYGDRANRNIAGKQLVLVPAISAEDEISWICGHAAPQGSSEPVMSGYARFTNIENKYLPRNCRE
jgi:type IV pilus assembly protein PilA